MLSIGGGEETVRRAAFVLVVLTCLAAMPVTGDDLPQEARYGGEFRLAVPTAPDLDPDAFFSNRLVQAVTYEALVRLGPNQTPVASLAQSWTPNSAAQTITFDLRPAQWPDGATIRAIDVDWSFRKHVDNGLLANAQMTVLDEDTIRFSFPSGGGGDFIDGAATLPVAWRNGDDTATPNGPFISPNSTSADLSLTPNPQYWGGRPYFDRLVFRFPYRLDKNPNGTTRADDAGCALMFREVDVIGWPVTQSELSAQRDCVARFGGFGGENRTLANPTRQVPHLGSIETPGLGFHFLGMNTQRAPLDDPLLRQAISRSIDRDSIVGTYGGGSEFAPADIADSPVSQANAAWFNPAVPRYRVPRIVSGTVTVPNLEEVNQFLDTAGYRDRDGDSWRDDPAGQPFGYTLLTYDEANDASVGKYSAIVQNLNAIGINVTQQALAPATLRSNVASNNFDLFVDTSQARGEPSFLFEMFHSTSVANMVNLNSAVLDGYLEDARDALNPADRSRAVADAQAWIAVNAPVAPILHYRSVNARDQESFAGWSETLGGVVNFWSLAQLYFTRRLAVTVEALDNGLRSREITTITVGVLGPTGTPVEGAMVQLQGPGLTNPYGVTDDHGHYRTTLAAPDVTSDQDLAIVAEVTTPGYPTASGNTTVTVHAFPRPFTITLMKGAAILESGEEAFVRVIVRDRENASLVEGATVSFTVSPAGIGGTVDLATGTTNAQGIYEATFRGDTGSLTRFLITATVSFAGYANETATTSVDVLARPSAPPSTPALDTISMVALVVVLSLLYGAWQRRKWIARKP